MAILLKKVKFKLTLILCCALNTTLCRSEESTKEGEIKKKEIAYFLLPEKLINSKDDPGKQDANKKPGAIIKSNSSEEDLFSNSENMFTTDM